MPVLADHGNPLVTARGVGSNDTLLVLIRRHRARREGPAGHRQGCSQYEHPLLVVVEVAHGREGITNDSAYDKVGVVRASPKFAEVYVVPRVNTFVAALVATSAVMLVISFFIDGTWWSNLLLQVGSSVILLVPFVWITKWLEGQIEKSESRTQTTVLELNREVDRIQADLARTTAEITDLVSQRFSNERNKDREVLAAVNTAPSREDIVRALRCASSELEIISTFGVRVPLEHTGLYLLFPPCAHIEGHTNDDLKIRLQTHELEEVMCVNWDAGISPVDFFHKLGIMLRDTNHWYGDESYTPGTALDALSRIFDLGYEAIVEGNASELNRIFQLVEGVEIDDSWAVTETALVHPKHFYHVPYRRFNELNWERHLNGKAWVNKDVIRGAIDVGVFLIRDKYVEGVLPDYLPGLWKPPVKGNATENEGES